MDTNSVIKKMFGKDRNRGIALVYLALIMLVLLAFVGLAIDIGYMYMVKTQLQNAADASALAGASKLKYVGPGGANPNDPIQSAARAEAIAFANKNFATKQNVVIVTDNSNTLSDTNDITVGHWDGTNYTPGIPVNAIQVRPRRTDASPGGSVNLFIGRVLGWEKMGAIAAAVAALPIRASSFVSICNDSCSGMSSDPRNPTIFPSPGRIYDRNPTTPGTNSFAWTSLLLHISSVTEISPLVCNEAPNEQVCGKEIWTTQGQASSLFKDIESVFNDPTFDRDNKTFDSAGNKVIEWRVLVPVTVTCNPGNQPLPLLVTKYAFVWITSVCDTGGGNPCRPYRSTPCSYPGQIVISRIACVDCADINKISGLKTVLVK